MNDVEALGDRVVVIKDGQAVFDGDLTALRARADIPREVVLTYRGAPVVPPEFTASSTKDGVRLPLGGRTVPELVRMAAGWGDLVDFRIVEAGLDEVMARVFGEHP